MAAKKVKNKTKEIELVVEVPVVEEIKNNEETENQPNIQEFEEIVSNLIHEAGRLKVYDHFGATAILDVIQLMMSKSEAFMKQLAQYENEVKLPETPEEVKKDVDEIIATIRANIKKK